MKTIGKKLKKRKFNPELIESKSYNPALIFCSKNPYKFLHEKITYDLLVPYNRMRLSRLLNTLEDYEVKYFIEENLYTKNVVISLGKQSSKKIVIGAHYDIVDNSFGINDNTCSVALLISFALELEKRNISKSVDIVFFDREETGMLGSSLYVENNHDKIDFALILDIIGVGDTLIFSTKNKCLENKLNNLRLKKSFFELPSDNLSFKNSNIPTGLITAVHKDDLEYLYDNVYQIDSRAKFYHSMHGGIDDNRIEVINFELIDELLKKLLELLSI